MKLGVYGAIAAGVLYTIIPNPTYASKATQTTNSATYPVRKLFKNTRHNVSHPVKDVTSPINQAGQTTTRTFHKVTN